MTMMQGNHDPEPTREDVLIGRVADGEATPADWMELERIAQGDAGLWERLARVQRAHARLEEAVEDSIAMCELVELPRVGTGGAGIAGRIGMYGGWLAAAAVSLAWVGVQAMGPWGGSGGNPSGRGGAAMIASNGAQGGVHPGAPGGVILASLTPEQALDHYLTAGMVSGRILSQMPTLYVDSRPAAGGEGREVVFIRQILERATVDDMTLLNLQQDERGQPVLVPREMPDQHRGLPL